MLKQGDQVSIYLGELNLLLFQPLATNKPQTWKHVRECVGLVTVSKHKFRNGCDYIVKCTFQAFVYMSRTPLRKLLD
jgi:hypothetical protein